MLLALSGEINRILASVRMIATITASPHRLKVSNRMNEDLVDEVTNVLDGFNGEESLKEIFWSILSYDQQRLTLTFDDLPPNVTQALTSVQLFAAHDKIAIVRADTIDDLSQSGIEQLCARLESSFPTLVVLLHSVSTDKWTCVHPDRTREHHLRFLPLPGPRDELRSSAKALAALTAVDWETDGPLQRLDVTSSMDVFFPGGMPQRRWEFDASLENTKYAKAFMRQKAAPIANLYDDISRYPLLTEAQERGEDYGNQVHLSEGMNDYRWRLVSHNIRLVINIALKFPTTVLDIDDLVQEGILGLVSAARKFDPARGNRFTTYAWYWIRQGILRGMENNQNLIRWPSHRITDLVPANKNGTTISLRPGERSVSHLDDDLHHDQLTDHAEHDPLEHAELRDAVNSTIERFLHPRDQRVLAMRFGLGDTPKMTLEETGEAEGVTRERIRQIEKKAIGRFKRALPEWIREEFEEEGEQEQEQED